jgi:hypothetical protein
MAFNIVVKPIVWFDLEEAITWYENERSGLGKQFFDNFEDAKEKIKISPNNYLNIIPGVKRILVKKFPYKVFYTISDNTVFIIGLTHAKRSNAFVRKRLKIMR